MRPSGNALAFCYEKLSVLQQTSLLVLIALIASEILVVIFYSIFFEDRLILDIVLTGVIVVIVGFPLGYIFVSQNARLRRMAVDLDRAAHFDDLTGLPNRRTFFAKAGLAFAAGDGRRGAFLFIDVDHFKLINDSLGHAEGDEVLRAVGVAIRRGVREGEIAARLGGEEFGVFLPRADRSIAFEVAERIRVKVAQAGEATGLGERAVTVSIGLALREEPDTLDAMMRRADRNLYTAKGEGRDRIVAAASRAA